MLWYNLLQASAVQYILEQNCSSSKMVLGLPAYGRTFTLADPGRNAVGDDVVGPGVAGPLTLSSGFLGFHEVSYTQTTTRTRTICQYSTSFQDMRQCDRSKWLDHRALGK